MASYSTHQILYAMRRGLCSCRELKQRRIRQGTKPDRAAFGEGPNMPIAAIETLDFEICYQHGFLVHRLAVETQAEDLSHCTVAAVASDEEICVDHFAG